MDASYDYDAFYTEREKKDSKTSLRQSSVRISDRRSPSKFDHTKSVVSVAKSYKENDENLLASPEKEFVVQDVPMLFGFTMFLLGLFVLGGISVTRGDPERYLDGYDSWGNVCGRKENLPIPNVILSGRDLSKNKYAFHMGLIEYDNAFNPIKYFYEDKKPAVICVKRCPKNITSCEKLLNESGYTGISQQYIDDNICVQSLGIILTHKPVLNRCVPSQIIRVVDKLKGNIEEKFDSIPANATSSRIDKQLAIYTKKVFVSIQTHWPKIISLTLVSVVLCFFMSIGLLCVARFLVVIACMGVIAFFGLAGYLWYFYFELKSAADVAPESLVTRRKPAGSSLVNYINETAGLRNISESAKTVVNSSQMEVYTYDTNEKLPEDAFQEPPNPTHYFLLALFVSLVGTVFVILLVYLRKHMVIIVKLFDEACYAIFCIPCVLLQPVATLIFLILLLFYFFVISAYIFASETPHADQRMFVEFVHENTTQHAGFFAAHLIGCYFFWEFGSACAHMIIAGAVANWYYRRERIGDCCPDSRIGVCPTLGPAIYVMKYNLGTAAAGSFLITLTALIRLVFNYAQKKAKEEDLSMVWRCVCSCVNCCCGLIGELIQFISNNAYIVAGMSGSSFITSGKRALTLLIISATTAWILHIVSGILLFLAKVLVAALTAVIAYYYFKNSLGEGALLSDYWFPVFLITIMSFFVALCFFNAFGNVLDTIFLCYCDDMDRNGGVALFSSDGLKERMDDVKKSGSDERFEYRDGDTPQPSGYARNFNKKANNCMTDTISKSIKF